MTEVRVPAKEHQDGCPADREESFETKRPDGEVVIVARCLRCGGQTVQPKEAVDAADR